MASRRRLPELDALRGLAAAAVMLHHNLLAADLMGGTLSTTLQSTPFNAVDKGRHAVMFFFVLSGFVLVRSLGDVPMTAGRYFAYISQRTVRLGLPVLASLLLSAALYSVFYAGLWQGEGWWLTRYLWQAPPTFGSLLEQSLLIRSAYRYEGNNVLWSLAHEWRLSLLIPAVAAFTALRGKNGALHVLLIGALVAGVAGGRWGETMVLNAGLVGQLKSTAYFVLPFAIGAALERSGAVDLHTSRPVVTLAVLAAAALARMDSDLSDYAASAVLIWATVHASPWRSLLLSRPLQWLGRLSFSLYLTHELIIAPLHHMLHASVGPVALVVLSCGLALLAAEVFYRVIEGPSHRLSRLVWRSLTQPQATASA